MQHSKYLVAALVVLALAPSVAYGAGTQLGLRVTDSSQFQGTGEGGQPGATVLGIRVTDSVNPTPLTVQVTFNANDGSGGVTTQTVPYNSALVQPANPVRDGYTFLGWFTAPSDGSLFDFASPLTADTALYAHWSLFVSCTVPTRAVITIDATGVVIGQSASFTSSTVVPLGVSAITCNELDGAASVIPNAQDRAATRVTLAPPAGSGSKVEIPLGTGTSSVAANFFIPQRQGSTPGELSVAFSLTLPQGTQLSYAPEPRDFVSLSYIVEPLTP